MRTDAWRSVTARRRMTVGIIHRLLDRLGIDRARLPAETLYNRRAIDLARLVARLERRAGRRGLFVARAEVGP